MNILVLIAGILLGVYSLVTNQYDVLLFSALLIIVGFFSRK